MTSRLLILAGVICCAIPAQALAQPKLHPLFSDGAVLQRDQRAPVWGTASPGERITVTLGSTTAEATADGTGRWRADLPAMAAGGPYRLTARSSAGSASVANVLVGDVWLCSGQSNMEMSVSRSANAPGEIGQSANDLIRLLEIPQTTSVAALEAFTGPIAWKSAGPSTVGEFSAACYFMARELQRTVNVPMGLIDSSWGGSAIEPWMSGAALRAVGGYEDKLDILAQYARSPIEANARWGGVWEGWWRGKNPEAAGREPWSLNPADLAQWKRAPGLAPWEKWGDPALAEFNGMVWMRSTVTLTAEQAARGAELSLGPVDDADQTWVNGRAVGSGSGANLDRHYPLPAGLLKAGRNDIVVNVLDTYAGGGIIGPAAKQMIRFADGPSSPITEWRYKVVPNALGSPPRAPWDTLSGVSVIYNAMIAPLGPYALRGVAWYQGESNAGEGSRYRGLLSGMMADWRRGRSAQTPFLIVQLPNYGWPPTAPGPSGWAELRESQRLAVEGDANARMAVTIDIGDKYELHPTNKQEVGHRLARAARNVTYSDPAAPSGPRPLAARREGGRIVVSFKDVEGSLQALGNGGPTAFELCGPAQASCRYVAGAAARDQVLLVDDGKPATRVRYCWADSPICNLFDASKLPASPFELAIP
jgi:sialate O-acetylesterase